MLHVALFFLLKSVDPAWSVVCSCKHQHRNRSADQSLQHLAQAMAELGSQSNSSVLLVSGGGKQRLKHYETVQVLRQLKQQGLLTRCPIQVAFNPYLIGGKEADEERLRLAQKLENGATGVYLQIGEMLCRGS